MICEQLTQDDWKASDVLVDAFEAAAAGVDRGTICATLGRLTWMYADETGKDLFRLLMLMPEGVPDDTLLTVVDRHI